MAGLPFIARPGETCRSFPVAARSHQKQRLLLQREVLLQTRALNPGNVRRKERRSDFIPYIRLCQVKYAALTHAKAGSLSAESLIAAKRQTTRDCTCDWANRCG
jgi:hypothetical protein